MFFCLPLLVAVGVFRSSAATISQEKFHDIVNYVNSLNTTWTAGHNFDPDLYRPQDLKTLCGVTKSKTLRAPKMVHKNLEGIPLLFDGREHWINCPSLVSIQDQGWCSSSWAISAVQAMTDRICIFSEGRITTQLSAQDLLSCCGEECGFGCQGGYPLAAWNYWKYKGIVTGQGYGSHRYCQPYSIPPCHHASNGKKPNCKRRSTGVTPDCSRSCLGNTTIDYKNDKYFALDAYEVGSRVAHIQMEIFKNGPVEATFTVYSDFFAYKGGVYHHVTGEEVGGHAVKLIGWGQMDGTAYWTAANSWNTDWGDNGFFLIKRGHNACGIEESIVAGRPDRRL